MEEIDMYDQEEDLPELDEGWVKDMTRLKELKELKAQIDEEIAHINEAAGDADLRGTYTDSDGNTYKVSLRRDLNAPRVTNAAALKDDHPNLWMEIATVQVDTKKLKDAVARGYFTGTDASKYLTQTFKKPWVQVTPLAKENEDTDE